MEELAEKGEGWWHVTALGFPTGPGALSPPLLFLCVSLGTDTLTAASLGCRGAGRAYLFIWCAASHCGGFSCWGAQTKVCELQ